MSSGAPASRIGSRNSRALRVHAGICHHDLLLHEEQKCGDENKEDWNRAIVERLLQKDHARPDYDAEREHSTRDLLERFPFCAVNR